MYMLDVAFCTKKLYIVLLCQSQIEFQLKAQRRLNGLGKKTRFFFPILQSQCNLGLFFVFFNYIFHWNKQHKSGYSQQINYSSYSSYDEIGLLTHELV